LLSESIVFAAAVVLAAAHFARDREPKVLITTCYKPSKGMYAFLAEMLVSSAVSSCTPRNSQYHTWCSL
jgi:hypothetical protein